MKQWLPPDYIVQRGSFKGLGFGLRNAVLRSGIPRDGAQDQTRGVVFYILTVF